MQGRRAILTGGASAGALALAALGYRAWDRGVWSAGKGMAYAPWQDWEGTDADGIKRPLRAAILAANPHDTQPWLFSVGDNAIAVFADRARNLGTFDPFRREMHLGIGAAIENLVLAACVSGWTAEVTPVDGKLALSPPDTPIPVAQISLTSVSASCHALVRAIPIRHTNRGAYRVDQAVARPQLSRFAELVASDSTRVVFVEDPQARRELGAVIIEATDRIVSDQQMSADSARWFRTGRRDIAAHADGVTADTSGLSPFMTAAAKILPELSAQAADTYWLSMTRDMHVATAPLLGILLVRDRLDMRSAIDAGRAWQRLHLAATLAGIAAQPLNQPVEWMDRCAMLGKPDSFGPTLAKFANAPGWEPTFVFRLGTAERPANVSPRRALAEVLKT